MTDEQYLERINALYETLRHAHSDTVALLAYAIGERSSATNPLRKKEFRRDTVRLDQIREALGKANIRMGQIESRTRLPSSNKSNRRRTKRTASASLKCK